jgi:hypothetical protein
MANEQRQRPPFIRYLGFELALLALAGGIYWYKVTYPDRAEPVPITPIAVSDRATGPVATEAVRRAPPLHQWRGGRGGEVRDAPRTLPVSWDVGPKGHGLELVTTVSRLTPRDHGATYHLEAEIVNRTPGAEVRQLRLVLECLSADGERIGVDSFEPLSPHQPVLQPGGRHAFTMTSAIDPRTSSISLLVHVRDEVRAAPSP